MRRSRVFLADDHALLLEAFTNLLEPRYDVVGAVTDCRQMLSMVSALNPDVVLLDIQMPNLNGLVAGEKLKKKSPHIKLIFLTACSDPVLLAQALRINADGYLLKSSAASELFEALKTVLDGGSYITPSIDNTFADTMSKTLKRANEKDALTLRQKEVLQLLAEGKTMKQVAATLHITPRTVAFHKYQIMENQGIKTNSELIQFAIKQRLLS